MTTIAILGGTGDLGTGLAIRWSKAGHNIIIGSRTQEKADAALVELKKISPDTPAQAMENGAAAKAGEIVVLTVPFAHQLSTLEAVKSDLEGKILIDVTVPLMPPKVGTVQMPPAGSAGKQAQDFLGDDVMVVTAFQNIAAHLLQTDVNIECDVLVAGNKQPRRTPDHQGRQHLGLDNRLAIPSGAAVRARGPCPDPCARLDRPGAARSIVSYRRETRR